MNKRVAVIDKLGNLRLLGRTFANLDVPFAAPNGSIAYCNNCTIANPCAGGGTGAFAKKLNSVWVCN
jgi:hypothetical protein